MRNYKYGFTLLEIILALGLLSIISLVAALPVFNTFKYKNDLYNTQTSIVNMLKRSRSLSQAMTTSDNINPDKWGVHIELKKAVLFKGASYVARDASKDEIYICPTSVSASGLSEIVFDKFTGDPLSLGTISLTTTNNETRQITINAKGTISY